jgi:hypothetical protein
LFSKVTSLLKKSFSQKQAVEEANQPRLASATERNINQNRNSANANSNVKGSNKVRPVGINKSKNIEKLFF